eukprot:m.19956 g.19956  ORF g.19956 m.19956 type:complete len:273 (+) comp3790_c0_seq1:39-857(+)
MSLVERKAGQASYIKLNVGGHLYYTTLSTLTKQGNNMLASMFSGRMEVTYDPDGWVIIDRDGRHFGRILNFLRDGSVALPQDDEELESLLAEARYYLLDGLVQAITQTRDQSFSPSCLVPVLWSDSEAEWQRLVQVSRDGPPVVIFAYHRGNNKFSYTPPSDDCLLKNIELFDKISTKFNGRITYAKDVSGRGGHICTWFFYGRGRLVAEICCTSLVYAGEKKHIKIEFPDARLYEENMNALLYENRKYNPAMDEHTPVSPARRSSGRPASP